MHLQHWFALYELIEEKKLNPELIIGVPVGFVNVVQSKELIMHTDVPYIVARGRKGGSNIAACICNALLYMIDNNRGCKKQRILCLVVNGKVYAVRLVQNYRLQQFAGRDEILYWYGGAGHKYRHIFLTFF